MLKSKSRKKKPPKRVLALADLEPAKTAVLNSLPAASSQRTYDRAIREFVAWYCSEPRLAFNRTSCSATGSPLSNEDMRRPPSTFGSPPFGAWRTRRRTPAF